MPKTLLSEFKDRRGFTIEETLKNFLNEKNGDLSSIANPHLARVIHSVLALCQDPRNFHGHDLIAALNSGFGRFKKRRDFSNYFGYSLSVIALCNAGQPVPNEVVQELLKGAYRKVSYHSSDIDSLILQALSCVAYSPYATMESKVYEASDMIVRRLILKQNRTSGAFGNQISTALVVMALQAARVHTDSYYCDKAMRNILTYQNDEGSFGSILANIPVIPSLLGQSFISLKYLSCPAEQTSTVEPPPIIRVHVQIVFNTTNLRVEPIVPVEMPLGKTAYDALELAKLQNPCYTATFAKLSWGRSITSICRVAKNWKLGYYWLIWVNGRKALSGVDGIKPRDGDTITFKYEKITL
ncbi:transcobalamin-2-like [Dendronephthya gigantea]|uniref:transcobalamin-2-like n=1 Tax=Dendronephthya gigantea TaxID=151771 RepID=UPI00106ACCA3|nr:transcobalamin-2-like [Dendronephthya gigantea]